MTDTKDILSPDDLAVAKELLRASRIWASGCTNDGFGAEPGNCEECNAAFLRHVAKIIGGAAPKAPGAGGAA